MGSALSGWISGQREIKPLSTPLCSRPKQNNDDKHTPNTTQQELAAAFGPASVADVVLAIQAECDAQGLRMLQRFLEERRVAAIAADAAGRGPGGGAGGGGGGGGGGPDPRAVEPLVQEVVLLLQRSEEYGAFMLGKVRAAVHDHFLLQQREQRAREREQQQQQQHDHGGGAAAGAGGHQQQQDGALGRQPSTAGGGELARRASVAGSELGRRASLSAGGVVADVLSPEAAAAAAAAVAAAEAKYR